MHHAIAQMHAFNKEFPKAKDCYKQMQSWHIAQSKNKQVFFPMQRTLVLDPALMLEYQATAGDADSERGLSVMRKLNALYLFGAWRNTLGIYKLDDDIVNESAKSPIPADTPASIFKNLPEWCVYIDLSSSDIRTRTTEAQESQKLMGFWAVFDYLEFEKYSSTTLNIVLDTNNPQDVYLPYALPLDDGLTVEEAVKRLQDTLTLDTDDVFANAETLSVNIAIIRQTLSFLLWLCVAEPDVTYKQEPVSREELTKPKFAKNKKTGAFIPPNEPFIYEIGSKLGGDIRSYQAKIDDDKKAIKSSRKRPHIRRGHWHGYWKGAGQAKEFFVKWQPAVFVNNVGQV